MRRAAIALSLSLPVSLLFASSALARDVPAPRYPLRDDVGLLDVTTSDAVRRACIGLERETTAELGVLIIDTTAGEDAHDFALRVFNAWGVGKAGADNGVLLVFAMNDRRVELVPGIAYEGLFTRSTTERLLTGVVVPRMRAGQPREAVLEGARAVAAKVREFERQRAGDRELPGGVGVELDTFGGGRLPEAAPPRAAPAPQTAPSTTPFRSSSLSLPFVSGGRDFVRGVLLLGLLAWGAGLFYVLHRTFSTGELVLSKGWIVVLALVVPAAAVALLAFTGPGYARLHGIDYGLGGAGLGGGLVVCGVVSHICPRCSKWMSIRSRTLVSPTYTSTGSGQRTYDCSSCSYHKVETYTIARRTRSSNRSSSRSSWSSSSRSSGGSSSRSSFGGGSSRGGGGGASW